MRFTEMFTSMGFTETIAYLGWMLLISLFVFMSVIGVWTTSDPDRCSACDKLYMERGGGCPHCGAGKGEAWYPTLGFAALWIVVFVGIPCHYKQRRERRHG